jgi:hypothetical protein
VQCELVFRKSRGQRGARLGSSATEHQAPWSTHTGAQQAVFHWKVLFSFSLPLWAIAPDNATRRRDAVRLSAIRVCATGCYVPRAASNPWPASVIQTRVTSMVSSSSITLSFFAVARPVRTSAVKTGAGMLWAASIASVHPSRRRRCQEHGAEGWEPACDAAASFPLPTPSARIHGVFAGRLVAMGGACGPHSTWIDRQTTCSPQPAPPSWLPLRGS